MAGTYVIPYSYDSSEVSLSGATQLPGALHATFDLSYAYRPYPQPSFIETPGSKGAPTGHVDERLRIDDRYGATASVSRSFGRYLSVDLTYTVVVNTSNINDTIAATRLDYDNKNYVKQMVEASVAIAF